MPRGTSLKERTNAERRRPPGLVYVELSPDNGGMMRDVFKKGFAMRAMIPLRVGDSTSFAFSIDVSTRIEGRCKIVWAEEEGRVVRLEFTEFAPEMRVQFEHWLNRIDEPPVSTTADPTSRPQEALTLDQLRQELRGVAPRPQVPAPTPPPNPVAEPPHQSVAELRLGEADSREGSALPTMRLPSPDLHIEPDLPSHVDLQPLPPLANTSPANPPVSPVATNLEPLAIDGTKAGIVIAPRKPSPWRSPPAIFLAFRMMFFLALVTAAIVYRRDVGNGLVWLGNKLSGSANLEVMQPAKREPVGALPPPSAMPSGPLAQGTSGANGPYTEADDAAQEKKPAEHAVPADTISKTPVPTAVAPNTSSSRPIGSSAEAGQTEYLAARDMLRGKHREVELPEAVRLLWVAVRKGNSNAEIALSELYRRGEGVTRNCDQTRILLSAAARKGNAEAQRRLEDFSQESCE